MGFNLLRRIRLTIFLLCAMASPSQLHAGQTNSIVTGQTAFALDLYGQFKTQPGNLFFSPYSVSSCLGLVCAGARGETEAQMKRVLHLNGNQGAVHASSAEVRRELAKTSQQGAGELNIANSLWIQNDHPIQPTFLQIASSEYAADIRPVNFENQPGPIVDSINKWVGEETKDRIKSLVSREDITDNTRLVIANAIYFKAPWATLFRKSETTQQPFHVSRDKQIKTPLMHEIEKLKYMESDILQAVELPYQRSNLTMVIILPRQIDGCGQVEKQLSPDFVAKLFNAMKQGKVNIYIPRFKLESEFQLCNALANLGMRDAFGSKADFSGINGTNSLFISRVTHKAWGEVNEEGTEAAAATGVSLATMSEPTRSKPPVFRADHPFIFMIRDTKSSAILFLGRLVNPTST